MYGEIITVSTEFDKGGLYYTLTVEVSNESARELKQIITDWEGKRFDPVIRIEVEFEEDDA